MCVCVCVCVCVYPNLFPSIYLSIYLSEAFYLSIKKIITVFFWYIELNQVPLFSKENNVYMYISLKATPTYILQSNNVFETAPKGSTHSQ